MKKYSSAAALNTENNDDEEISYYNSVQLKPQSRSPGSNDKFDKLIETGKRLLQEGKIPQALDSYSTSKKYPNNLISSI